MDLPLKRSSEPPAPQPHLEGYKTNEKQFYPQFQIQWNHENSKREKFEVELRLRHILLYTQ